jgi:hypothetical protein
MLGRVLRWGANYFTEFDSAAKLNDTKLNDQKNQSSTIVDNFDKWWPNIPTIQHNNVNYPLGKNNYVLSPPVDKNLHSSKNKDFNELNKSKNNMSNTTTLPPLLTSVVTANNNDILVVDTTRSSGSDFRSLNSEPSISLQSVASSISKSKLSRIEQIKEREIVTKKKLEDASKSLTLTNVRFGDIGSMPLAPIRSHLAVKSINLNTNDSLSLNLNHNDSKKLQKSLKF